MAGMRVCFLAAITHADFFIFNGRPVIMLLLQFCKIGGEAINAINLCKKKERDILRSEKLKTALFIVIL